MPIRPSTTTDMSQLMAIWLQASLHAFDQLPAARWWPKEEAMRKQLESNCDIWVLEVGGAVHGFMALKGHELLALYIHPEQQGQGMGSALLNLAKRQRGYLHLRVLADNREAIDFYRRRGFAVTDEGLASGEELQMEYHELEKVVR